MILEIGNDLSVKYIH